MKKGDRVALIMRNLPEWPVAFYGAAILGAIVTPLNAWWTGPELEYGLVDSGAKVAIVDAERLERIAEHFVNCPALERVYVSRYPDELPHPIVTRLEDALGAVERLGHAAGPRDAGCRHRHRTTTRRSSTLRARRVSPKARSARIAT